MKFRFSACLMSLFLFTATFGCGNSEPRQATENADADAIAEYEAAVAESEGNMEESMEETLAETESESEE